MPVISGVISALVSPEFASLHQVLDTSGPYSAGDHLLTSFTTGGAFLLPAGTYDVGGTYGVLAIFNGTIPPQRGYVLGWNDDLFFPVGDRYHLRFAQLVLEHQLPISGAWVPLERWNMHYLRELYTWPVLIGSGGRLGLHVEPGCAIDLYYMCVL